MNLGGAGGGLEAEGPRLVPVLRPRLAPPAPPAPGGGDGAPRVADGGGAVGGGLAGRAGDAGGEEVLG